MPNTYTALTIDEYLRKRLMPVEGVIPHLQGIEMYGNSIPAEVVGGDLFEYINFQQRYDIEARILRALKLSKEYLGTVPAGTPPRNSVDDHVRWLKSRAGLPARNGISIQRGAQFGTGACRGRSTRIVHHGGRSAG